MLKESAPRKLLILTSSGGGGLIQAANAKEQQMRAMDPGMQIIRRDILKDWVWLGFGNFCIYFWNSAQERGDVAGQGFCISAQHWADYFFWPCFFFSALFLLFREEVDLIIDTQPLGTSAVLTALKIYNRRRKKEVRLQKVVVDLPTRKAVHFFRPIKALSETQRKNLDLITIAPLLEEGQTREEFWNQYCGLSDQDIHYEEVYVREAFRKFQGREHSFQSMSVLIAYKNEGELALIQKCLRKGNTPAQIFDGEIAVELLSEAFIVTILLGSHPSNQATFKYVQKFLQVFQEKPRDFPLQIFVFCAEHREGEESLFWKVVEHVNHLCQPINSCSVIPFSFQNEKVIAPLFYRSDLTCTRSGGQTAMELLCVSKGENWIHSEAKHLQDPPSLEELLQGIPGWEAENAVYLQRVHGAKFVTTELAERFFRKALEEKFPLEGVPNYPSTLL